MNGLNVCWNCKGLSIGSKLSPDQMDNHKRQCSKESTTLSLETSIFDHYVCEKTDFFALLDIKQSLNKEVCLSLLKNRQTASLMDVPNSLVDSLLKLSISRTLETPRQNTASMPAVTSNNSFSDGVFRVNISDPVVHSSISSPQRETPNPDLPASVPVTCDKESKSSLNLLTENERIKLSKECNSIKKGNFEELICKLCAYQTKSNKIMLRHLNSHNDGQAFHCKQCNFSTKIRSNWKLHKCNQQGGNFLCHHCPKRFPSQNKLDHHLSTLHSEKCSGQKSKLQCDICGYKGRDQMSLKEHQRKHTGEVLLCPHDNCKFKTSYKRSLQKHLQHKHSKEKTQICEVCGFQTRHVASLQKHIKLHTDTKQYKCAECSYCSHNTSDVILHVRRKHLKQKNHSCPKCPYQSGYLLAMKKHMARHQRMEAEEAEGKRNVKTKNTKYYSCSICGEFLNSINKAKEHIKRFHNSAEFQILNNKSVTTTTKPLEEKVKYVSEPGVFNEKNMNLDNLLDVDISSDVLDITSNILNNEVIVKDSYAPGNVGIPLPDDSMCQDIMKQYESSETKSVSRKGGNPMLSSATSDALADADNSLIEESLFDLMSDFPRPPTLNRCQSASTLMFQSFTQHMVDRPLTPDFFTDSPAQSFFQNLSSRSMEHDNFAVSSLNQQFQISSGFSSQIDLTGVPVRTNKPPSPVLPTFVCSPPHQSVSQPTLDL